MSRATHPFACSLLLCAACSHSTPPGEPTARETTPTVGESQRAPIADDANQAETSASLRQRDLFTTPSGDIALTPILHGTLLIEFAGQAVYFDPTSDGDYKGLPKAAAIFVTDIHQDHLDPAAIESLSTAETIIVAPAAVADKLTNTVGRVSIIKNGEVKTGKAMLVPQIPSLGVEAVPMYNKKRGPAPGTLYHDKGRGNGYLLSFGGKRIYVSGDTECIDEMKGLKDIDLAFVCMNLPYTMPPSEAAECIAAFQPKIVYPYHYRDSDPQEVSRALQGQPIEIRLRRWY